MTTEYTTTTFTTETDAAQYRDAMQIAYPDRQYVVAPVKKRPEMFLVKTYDNDGRYISNL